MITAAKGVVRRMVGDRGYLLLAVVKLRVRRGMRWVTGRDPRVVARRPRGLAIERHGDWYACPQYLTRGALVYSIGIGRDLSFDRSLIARHGARVFAFDPTPDALAWVRQQQLPAGLVVREVGLAAYDGIATFAENVDKTNPSFSFVVEGGGGGATCEVRRLATLMAAEGHAALDVLKLDIEGAEYEVIDDILGAGIAIGQILIEFHHRKLPGGTRMTARAIDALRRGGYRLVHISPGGQEFLFLSASAHPAR